MYKNVKITLAAAILYVLLMNIQNSLTLSAICLKSLHYTVT